MEKTQKEIDAIKSIVLKTTIDPVMIFACGTLTFCNKCEEWWPCKCPESKVMEAFFEKE